MMSTHIIFIFIGLSLIVVGITGGSRIEIWDSFKAGPISLSARFMSAILGLFVFIGTIIVLARPNLIDEIRNWQFPKSNGGTKHNDAGVSPAPTPTEKPRDNEMKQMVCSSISGIYYGDILTIRLRYSGSTDNSARVHLTINNDQKSGKIKLQFYNGPNYELELNGNLRDCNRFYGKTVPEKRDIKYYNDDVLLVFTDDRKKLIWHYSDHHTGGDTEGVGRLCRRDAC